MPHSSLISYENACLINERTENVILFILILTKTTLFNLRMAQLSTAYRYGMISQLWRLLCTLY